MDNMLEETLVSFKKLSTELLDCLNKEDNDNLEELLDKRGKLIETISTQNFNQNDFITISSKLELVELENQINKLLSEKKHKARIEIEKVNTVKKANNNYQRNFQPDSLFFNRKI